MWIKCRLNATQFVDDLRRQLVLRLLDVGEAVVDVLDPILVPQRALAEAALLRSRVFTAILGECVGNSGYGDGLDECSFPVHGGLLLLGEKVFNGTIPRLVLKLQLAVLERQLHSLRKDIDDRISDQVPRMLLMSVGHDQMVAVNAG